MLDEGHNVVVISQQLGHSNLATTNTYLNHLKPADVVAAMQTRPGLSGDSKEPSKTDQLLNCTDQELGAMFRKFLQSQNEQ